MSIRRLRLGLLLSLPLRACSPLLRGSSYSHLVPSGSNPVLPNPQWQLVMEGLALRSLRHRGVYGASASLGPPTRSTSGGMGAVGMGRTSRGEYEGLTPYSHFPPTPNPAISTNGNGSGDVSHPPRRPVPVGPKDD